MSYRNPQIIIDRSAEVWAQGVAKVGDVLNKGIEAYFAAKKKGEEVQKKKDEAINTTMIQGDLKQSALRNKMSKTIKDVTLQQKFTERAKLLADGDGGDNKGAIWYNTQLTLNPPKDKAILKKYKDKVKAYQSYMSNSAQEIGYVTSALEMTKDKSAQQLVDNYAVAGDSNINELQNLMAMRALENKALEGFSYEKDLVYNEDGTNSLKVVGYLDKDSKTYNAWKNANAFDEDELEYDKDGRVKITWERNLAKWGEEGQFVNEISPAIDINSVMENSGLINKNGTANESLYVTPTLQQTLSNQDGTKSLTTERVLDYNKLFNNSAFKSEIKSKAAGLDARSEKDQIDFVRNRFGWGDMKTEDFFSKSREDRLAFYEGQLEMEAVKKLGNFRKATSQDVKTLQEVMPGIKENDPIIFKELGRRAIKPIEEGNKSEAPIIAKNYIDSFLKDPVSFLEDRFSVGEEGSFYKEMSFKDGLITVRPPDKEFKVGKGDDAIIELEEQEEKSFPINSSQGKRLLRDLIKNEVGGDKASREIMRIIDKTFPKGSKNSFTEGLKNSTPLTEEQKKQDFEDFVEKQSRDGGRKANQDFN
jgi:hypothetical protein